MQFPEMVAFNHILRSQSSLLLNPSKFVILYPSINSLIHLKQNPNDNPNFSRHFRLIQSNTCKLSPEAPQEPDIEAKPRVWSVFGSKESYPRNEIKSDNREMEVESMGNRVDVSEEPVSVSWSLGGKGKTGKSKVHWVCSNCGHCHGEWWWGKCKSCKEGGALKRFSVENERSGGRVSGHEISENAMKSYPRKAIKSEKRETGVESTGNRVDVSEEPDSGSWCLGGKGKTGKSKVHWVCSNCGHSHGQWWGKCNSCKEGGTLNRVDVSEANSMKVMPQEPDIVAKPRVWSLFESCPSKSYYIRSYPRNVTKPENSEMEVESTGNRVNVSEANSMKVTPQEPDIEAKPRVWSVFGWKESYPRNVTKSENSD